MNQIRCYNSDGDEVHVISGIADMCLKSTVEYLDFDMYFVVIIIFKGRSFTLEEFRLWFSM